MVDATRATLLLQRRGPNVRACGRATVAQADGGERETYLCEKRTKRWLQGPVGCFAWKYDLDLTDISTQIPSMAVVPLEEVTVSDEKRLHATEEVDL